MTATSTTGGLLRLAGGAGGSFELRRWGALLSALALVAFIANTAAAVLRGRRGGRPRRQA